MKIKVGLFFGGRSVEHEVSIITALQALEHFNKEKYDVVPVYITHENEFYVGDGIGDISRYGDIPALLKSATRVIPVCADGRLLLRRAAAKHFGSNDVEMLDVVFPAVHGTNVEDGALQGFFRTMRVPFAGCDVLASALGMDKYAAKIILRDAGIPVLPAVKVDARRWNAHRDECIAEAEAAFGYPMIVKPVDLGSSVGISRADYKDALIASVDDAFRFARTVIIERAVVELREINCAVLGDADGAEASECEEPVSAGSILSYDDKYGSGGQKGMSGASRYLPAPIDAELREKIRALAVEAFLAVGCSGVTRVDFIMDKNSGEVWVNELNTIPGSLAFYLFNSVGMSYEQMLERMISMALKRERQRDELSFSFKTNILQGRKGFGTKGTKGIKGAKM